MSITPPLVSVDDLGTYMRTVFTGDRAEQAELVLRVVSAWARTVGGRQWNNTDLLPPDDVIGVVLSAARREMTNPDRIISNSMGPLAVRWADPPHGFFTSGEMAILRRKSSGSLYTISTRREERSWGDGYTRMHGDVDSNDLFPITRYGEPDWPGMIHP